MKRKIIARGALGFPLGIALGHIITVLISLIKGSEDFLPCAPQFVELIGSEAGAVALQTLLCGIIGTGYAAASVIWEMDNLSIAKQTAICLSIYAAVMLPIAYFTGWMGNSLSGILIYIGIFLLTFAVVWISQYLAWKSKLKALNAKLTEE